MLNCFFASDELLNAATAMAVGMLAVNLYAGFRCGWYAYFIMGMLMMIFIISLFVAFKRHNKNVQKGLFGVVLCWGFLSELNFDLTDIVFSGKVVTYLKHFWGTFWMVMLLITLAGFALYFLNYFLIAGSHLPSPKKTATGQILCFVFILATLLSLIYRAVSLIGDSSVFLESVSWHLFFIGYMLMLTSYQTHFEVWREERAA